jgi:hypothetical protein
VINILKVEKCIPFCGVDVGQIVKRALQKASSSWPIRVHVSSYKLIFPHFPQVIFLRILEKHTDFPRNAGEGISAWKHHLANLYSTLSVTSSVQILQENFV